MKFLVEMCILGIYSLKCDIFRIPSAALLLYRMSDIFLIIRRKLNCRIHYSLWGRRGGFPVRFWWTSLVKDLMDFDEKFPTEEFSTGIFSTFGPHFTWTKSDTKSDTRKSGCFCLYNLWHIPSFKTKRTRGKFKGLLGRKSNGFVNLENLLF